MAECSNRFDPTQQGFSTLEALVAIAILGIALVPLLSFQGQLTSGSLRLEARAQRLAAEQVAYDYLGLIDYSKQATGTLEIGDGWVLSWSSQPEGPLQPVRYGAGLSSRYSYQVLDISATISKDEQGSVSLQRTIIHATETAPAAPL